MSALPTSIQAEALAQRIRSLSARPQSITVRELIERRMGEYRGRDLSLVQRMATWQALLGDFTLDKIDADVIHAARAEIVKLPALAYKGLDHQGQRVFKTKGRQKPKSAATVNRYMAALSALFSWAIEERLAPRGWVNPCRGIKRLKGEHERVRFLDEAERARLLAACRSSRYPRLHALVLTAMLSGARRGELMGLKWRDVDLEAGLARLGRTKNGDRRTLVLLPQVVEALRPFAGEPARFVFGSAKSRHQAPASIDTAWRKAIERAKIDDFRFHDLRHCCASYLVQAGVDLSVVADVLGHRKLDMTKRYAHLKTETKATAMRAALGTIAA
ncbi:MAG: tyrosine-type recombinase/integrase [Burkholderiales bacterium]